MACSASLLGQEPDKMEVDLDISVIVQLDSLTVTASKEGFDVNDFIQLVQEDESFITAFHNLRFLNYLNRFDFNYRTDNSKSNINCKTIVEQVIKDTCRVTHIVNEEFDKKYFKDKEERKYRFYTSKMHERLFLAFEEKCSSPIPQIKPGDQSKMEKYVSELKKFIFKPGEEADIPFIGDKTAIFENHMTKYYDYLIGLESYNTKQECYTFTARLKEEYIHNKKNKTVIKYLKTYFAKNTLQVLARDYQIEHNTGLYKFDIDIEIELLRFKNKYVPASIVYDGYWKIPLRKKEDCRFELSFSQFEE